MFPQALPRKLDRGRIRANHFLACPAQFDHDPGKLQSIQVKRCASKIERQRWVSPVSEPNDDARDVEVNQKTCE